MYTLTELLLNNPGVKIRLKYVDDEYPYIDVKVSRGDSSVRSNVYTIPHGVSDADIEHTIHLNIDTLKEGDMF
jgi:hypothetical protein